MITLCMDTSSIFLALSVLDDDKVLAKVQESCWKRQSEEIFPAIERMLSSINMTSDDIDQVVVTEGPGSYTGVRIAMTIAKVFCAMGNHPLYTVGTLQLFAGLNANARVVLDARGKRGYTALYQNGKLASELQVLDIDEIPVDGEIIGDGHLLGKEDVYPDLAENFLALKPYWVKAENVHFVKPEYLKSSESYLVKH